MNLGKTLFAQLMDLLFHRIVDCHNGDRYVKSMTCAEQFRVMAFAQLTYRESLRDIEVCLSAQSAKRYHMGLRQEIKRAPSSSLAQSRTPGCDAFIRLKSIEKQASSATQPSRLSVTTAAGGYPAHLRGIRFKDPESGKTLVFLTNNFALPAQTICALYKARWQVELFFKWPKEACCQRPLPPPMHSLKL